MNALWIKTDCLLNKKSALLYSDLSEGKHCFFMIKKSTKTVQKITYKNLSFIH